MAAIPRQRRRAALVRAAEERAKREADFELVVGEPNIRGHGLCPGDQHYRAYVGQPHNYDVLGAMQFSLLIRLGMRDHHHLLDIGCGSLCGGRLAISYLLPDRYCGIEPEHWLVEQGIENELGWDVMDVKRPVFSQNSDFDLSVFRRNFDFAVARSIFSHTSQDQIRKCFSEMKKVLKTTGIFAASFVSGNKDYQGKEWVYPRCITYRLGTIQKLARESGLECRPVDWHGIQQWVVVGSPENSKRLANLSRTVRRGF